MPDGLLVGTGVGTYTVADLCGLALRQIGVGAAGTTAAAADLSDAVFHLNLMLAQWQRRRWMVPALVDLACVSTGSIGYTIGNGAQFDTGGARPERIDAAYVRWLGNGTPPTIAAQFNGQDFSSDFALGSGPVPGGPLALDYPLTLLPSREDYVRIGIKNFATWPALGFYSPDFPYGTLYLAPVPIAAVWEVHVLCKQTLPSALTLASVIQLPDEFQDAVMWCLAERLAPSYGQEVSPTVAAFARQARQTVRQAATRVPLIEYDPYLLPRWGGDWSLWGGCGGAGGGGGGPTPPPVTLGKPIAAGTWVVGLDYVGNA